MKLSEKLDQIKRLVDSIASHDDEPEKFVCLTLEETKDYINEKLNSLGFDRTARAADRQAFIDAKPNQPAAAEDKSGTAEK